jgi:hypothetical protein
MYDDWKFGNPDQQSRNRVCAPYVIKQGHIHTHRIVLHFFFQKVRPMLKPAQSSSRGHLWGTALLALTCLGLAAPALAYQSGDWVLAKYRNGPHWYPGVVQSDNSGGVSVAYDDGDRETLAAKQVKTYNWAVGTVVECNWKKGGQWFRGKITSLSGGNLSVAYDDGDREKTTTGMCRSQ